MRPMLCLATLLIASPVAALAAGTGSTAPTPTETTQTCTGAQVYDAETKTCVDAQESRLDDATRIDAARELAAFDRPRDALDVLAHVTRKNTPEVLTLRGFATRKAGDFDAGRALYESALAIDPDYILARSYLGQALAERGDTAAARQQLAMIRQAGGRETWAETSLADAIRTGRGYSH
ncbi:tetratricopeptide repeat protein [Jannaschia sp. 2305UL9-9]|uniref:tetratricopeptide repeat protein n=1 Tax=Jannaschia sp. 2305UL9-9 TaxID=3121638 RepID=UPI003527D70A